MRSSTPADSGKPSRRWTRRGLRALAFVAVLATAGCAARLSGFVESVTFFVPSTEPFGTPAGFEDVSIPVGERARLHGWWLRASQNGQPSRGTILFCHGNAGSLPSHLAFVEPLAEHGFDVLMFDYRGYGRSSSIRRLSRQSLLRDAKAARRFLEQRDPKPTEPVVVVGHSMGAVIGAALVADRADAFDGAVLVAPFSSFPRVASDFAGPLGWLLISSGLAAEEQVARFRETPVLIVHGERDAVVRSYHSERILAAADRAGVWTESLFEPQGDHINIFDRRFETADRIASFIDRLGSRDSGARDPTTNEDSATAASPAPGG